MILGYIVPLLFVLGFFVSAYFLMNGIAKIFLVLYLLYLMVLPFLLLYKQEVKEYRQDTDKILNDEESGA
ncbi:hypothetical protein ACJROX_12345 [Pseudalkalibacillus sp. A8]|uniref:hypothetical protein n=1 Tax=Pseudalkalibacillus sp. A8 TaxID=3382641 RepID=UPI0038B59C72